MRNGLTALRVKQLRRPGRHADGGGLYLAVSPAGAKSWVFMWKRHGKRHARGLGSADTVPLADARELAADARRAVHVGRDPRPAQAESVTFGQMADELFASMSMSWRNAKHRGQWQRTLVEHCRPLRAKPVHAVGLDDVLAVLKPLWTTRPETAARTRGRVEKVLDFARARGHRGTENPARWKGHLDALLPRRGRLARNHFKALPYADLPAFMAQLRSVGGVSASALEYAILTGARSGEVLGATWAEIDLDAQIWTVPAARMKGAREHRVPLSPRCVVILEKMAGRRASEYVFPGRRDHRPMSATTLTGVIHQIGLDVTAHGFRSSFRDWCGDCTHFPREIAEAALAHLVGDSTERAYRRGDAFEKRHELMLAWAGYCEPREGNVVTLRRTK
jgi:integrase